MPRREAPKDGDGIHESDDLTVRLVDARRTETRRLGRPGFDHPNGADPASFVDRNDEPVWPNADDDHPIARQDRPPGKVEDPTCVHHRADFATNVDIAKQRTTGTRQLGDRDRTDDFLEGVERQRPAPLLDPDKQRERRGALTANGCLRDTPSGGDG
jgi:hypothetical protein